MDRLKKEKDVRLRITTRVEGDKFITEALGEYAHDDEARYIAYKDQNGNDVTFNGLHLAKDKVYLHRAGAVSSDMLFDPKTTTRATYRTMGMEMNFIVRTHRYDVLVAEKLIVVDLRYSLQENAGAPPTRYALKIEIHDV